MFLPSGFKSSEKAKNLIGQKEIILFERFVEEANLDHVKIEFQGGEPTLRLDIIQEIIDIVKEILNLPSLSFVQIW